MKKTAIILGTSRSNGNTALLAEEIKNKTNATIFDINNYNISAFDYDYKNKDDDYKELIKEVLTYDNIIFASPVYWYSPSSQMKLFLERITDLLTQDRDLVKKFKEKNALVLSTGAYPEVKSCFEESFIHSFEYLGMNYKGMLYLHCEFDESGESTGVNIDLIKHKKQIIAFINKLEKE